MLWNKNSYTLNFRKLRSSAFVVIMSTGMPKNDPHSNSWVLHISVSTFKAAVCNYLTMLTRNKIRLLTETRTLNHYHNDTQSNFLPTKLLFQLEYQIKPLNVDRSLHCIWFRSHLKMSRLPRSSIWMQRPRVVLQYSLNQSTFGYVVQVSAMVNRKIFVFSQFNINQFRRTFSCERNTPICLNMPMQYLRIPILHSTKLVYIISSL